MKKIAFFILIVFVWLIGINAFSHLRAEELHQGKPVISFDKEIFDAGRVLEGEELSHSFTLFNRGDVPLVIKKIRRSRNCIIVDYDDTIPPGGSGKITLKIKTLGKEGKASRHAVVFSNDPENPRKRIQVNLRVTPLISVNPSRVFFNGFAEEQLQKEIIIHANTKDPICLELEKQTLPEKVTCTLSALEHSRSYKLVVKNLLKNAGTYRGRIIFKTGCARKPYMVVPVFGRIKDVLEVVPRVLDFGWIKKESLVSKSYKKRLGKNLFIRLNRGDDLKICGVEIDNDFFRADTSEIKPGEVYKICVSPVPGEIKKGEMERALLIHTNQKRFFVVEIPVRIKVK